MNTRFVGRFVAVGIIVSSTGSTLICNGIYQLYVAAHAQDIEKLMPSGDHEKCHDRGSIGSRVRECEYVGITPHHLGESFQRQQTTSSDGVPNPPSEPTDKLADVSVTDVTHRGSCVVFDLLYLLYILMQHRRV